MARAGRKRKFGSSHLGEKPVSKKKAAADDRVRIARQPHRRIIAREMRANGVEHNEVMKATQGEEAESPIGRLWLTGHLHRAGDADVQPARDRFDAGNMFAQVVGAYRSVIETPREVSGSGRGYLCDPPACKIDPDVCECLRRRRRYMAAYEALAGGLRRFEVERKFGKDMPAPLREAILEHARIRDDENYARLLPSRRRVLMAVLQVVVHRQAIGDQELVYLVEGLEELRQHFGLTERRRRKHTRNAN